MQKLIVNEQGQLVIPAEAVRQLGFRPGEQAALVQTHQGLLLCSAGIAAFEEWWQTLSNEEKQEARSEAAEYESLSEAEKDAFWNQGNEELEKWLDSAEDDEPEDAADDLAVIEGAESAHPLIQRAA